MKNKIRIVLVCGIIISILIGLTACGENVEIVQLSTDLEINSDDSLLTMISCNDENAVLEIIETNLNIKRIGRYMAKFSASSDNKSVERSFEFNVVDTIPPEVKEATDIELEQNEVYSLENYLEVSDNSGVQTTIEFDETNFRIGEIGEFVIPYKVTDISGNVFEDNLDVKVELHFEKYELQAIILINFLKNNLKNPDSLQVHDIECKKFTDKEKSSHFKIDFSAQNGFGGLNRETYYIEVLASEPDLINLDNSIMSFEKSNFVNNSSALHVNLDIDKLMNNLDKTLF